MGDECHKELHCLLDANKNRHMTAEVPLFSFQTSYINLCNVMFKWDRMMPFCMYDGGSQCIYLFVTDKSNITQNINILLKKLKYLFLLNTKNHANNLLHVLQSIL
jgi:hypothetical protein